MSLAPGSGATARTAGHLLVQAAADDLAQISPSYYETARLVALAPWLQGHRSRLDWLCGGQAVDGGWGVPGFRLVPTLSVVEALLAEQSRTAPVPDPSGWRRAAAELGLAALRRWLSGDCGEAASPLPDTVAIELIVPRLIDLINEHLARMGTTPLPHARATAPDLLRRVRAATRSGVAVPPKLWHTWETIGSGRPGDAAISLVDGAVSCSPAATAAWLGDRPQDHPEAVRFLENLQRAGGGLVPVATPMPFFERSWMLCLLHSYGLSYDIPAGLLDGLEAALGPHGAPAGPGLPPDTDDTACILHALAVHGRDPDLDSLMSAWADDHFFCYPEERTASPTTNAHALEALRDRALRHPEEFRRLEHVITATVKWLLATQRNDGSWDDKWHASIYYSTACCATALRAAGVDDAAAAVSRAAGFVRSTRHEATGGWGLGTGNREETAFAVQVLAADPSPDATAQPGHLACLQSAAEVLIESPGLDEPTLWIGKDLYTPNRIVEANRLGALQTLARKGITAGAAR